MKRFKPILAALLLTGLGALGYAYAATRDAGACPGKIVCPLSGETICADQCPAK